MKRSDLEHLLRAAGRVIGADQIIVVGSQAILATIPETEYLRGYAYEVVASW